MIATSFLPAMNWFLCDTKHNISINIRLSIFKQASVAGMADTISGGFRPSLLAWSISMFTKWHGAMTLLEHCCRCLVKYALLLLHCSGWNVQHGTAVMLVVGLHWSTCFAVVDETCSMERQLCSSWVYINQHIFHVDMRQIQFSHICSSDLDLWPFHLETVQKYS